MAAVEAAGPDPMITTASRSRGLSSRMAYPSQKLGWKPLPPLLERLHVRGVSRIHPGGRIHEVDRVVYGDGRLGEAGRDQVELPLVIDDVAGRVDTGNVRGHQPVHQDPVL